jgi:hypothetical protein
MEPKLMADAKRDETSTEAHEATEQKTCRCGHDRDHYMVTVDKEYSAGGWFTVLFGISTVPSKVKFRCTLCGDVLEELTDPAALKKHIR